MEEIRVTIPKCDQCKKEFKQGDTCHMAVGLCICDECNQKNGGTISMELVMDKIMEENK